MSKERQDLKKLGREIRSRMKNLGMTQHELARKSGVSQSYISKLARGESHRFSADVLHSIGKELQIDHLHLMNLAGIPVPKAPRDPSVEHVAQRLESLPELAHKGVIDVINAQIDLVVGALEEQKKEAIFAEDDPMDKLIFKEMLPPLVEALKILREEDLEDYKGLMGRLRIAYDLREKRLIQN